MGKVNIHFKTHGADKAEKQTKGIGAGIASMTKSAVGFAAAGIGIASVFKIFKSMVDAAAEQEKIFRGLQTTIELSGKSYENLSGSLGDYFEQLQRTTIYGDTDSAKVLTTLVQLTGNYDKALKALPLTLDIASTGLFDINTAARNVAMSLEGNIELMARYLPELKASVTPFLKTASAAEKAEFAINLLNEKFGGTAQEAIKTYAGQMSILGNRLDDVLEKYGDLYLKAMDVTGALGFAEGVARELSDSFLNLSPAVLAVNLAMGETVKAVSVSTLGMEDWIATGRHFTETQQEIIDFSHLMGAEISDLTIAYSNWKDAIQAKNEEAVKELAFMIMYKEELGIITDHLAIVGETGRMAFEPMTQNLEKIPKLAETAGNVLGESFSGIAVQYEQIGDALSSTMQSAFDASLIRGENFFQSLGDAFSNMLQRMLTEMLAKAVIFGLLNLITKGGASGLLGAGGLDFISGGMFSNTPTGGQANTAPTININAPVVDKRIVRAIGEELNKYNRLQN